MATKKELTEEERLENLRCRPEWWWGDDSKEYWRENNTLIKVYSWEDSETRQLISEIEVGSL